jgi:hypothetical protein
MDVRTLGEIESGFHAPMIITAKQIAEALEVGLADLVEQLPDRPPRVPLDMPTLR